MNTYKVTVDARILSMVGHTMCNEVESGNRIYEGSTEEVLDAYYACANRLRKIGDTTGGRARISLTRSDLEDFYDGLDREMSILSCYDPEDLEDLAREMEWVRLPGTTMFNNLIRVYESVEKLVKRD